MFSVLTRSHLFALASVFLVAQCLLGLSIIMLLNGSVVNQLNTPVTQYWDLFKLIWIEQPITSLEFILNKSVLTFAHRDPRSGLNLWTLEYSSITLAVYVSLSLGISWIQQQWARQHYLNSGIRQSILLSGATLCSFSVTYMTALEHCSGATWVGFVSLYGMEWTEFELYPAYQYTCALLGMVLLAMVAFTHPLQRLPKYFFNAKKSLAQ